jgi:hypothetical protein
VLVRSDRQPGGREPPVHGSRQLAVLCHVGSSFLPSLDDLTEVRLTFPSDLCNYLSDRKAVRKISRIDRDVMPQVEASRFDRVTRAPDPDR